MTPAEQRRARERESIFSALYDIVNQQNAQLASEGRRPVLGGLLSKEPVEGVDTIRYEGIGNMLAGLLAPAAKAFDAPLAAAQGNIPREDMLSEALGTAGMAMLGGGVVPLPKGAVGANALRKQITTEPEFRPETWYHGTRSDIDQFDPRMVDLGVHVGTKGQANERLVDLIKKENPVYAGPFDSFKNIEGQKETSVFRSGGGSVEGSQILPLRVRANSPLRMPDVGEWDRSEVVMYNLEKMLAENDDPKLLKAFEDFDFEGLDDDRSMYYDNSDWKVSDENRMWLNDIKKRIESAGYDSIVYKNIVESASGDIQDSMIVLDPKNLRSVNAKFDPEKEWSSDLLAANKSKVGGILGGLLGRSPTFEEAPMIVQHNISPEGLAISNQIGGIPMPSIGIAGAKAPLENFGEVTLMLNPEKIAPRRDLPVYPADAFTGRQPRAFMDFVDEDQVRKNFRADPRFEHIGSSWLDSYSLDDADYMMKIVERGIDEKLIDPKNFDDFRKMYREAEAKLGADAYDTEAMVNAKGLSQYGDMQLSIAPEDWYTPSGNRRSPKPYTVEEAYKRMNKKKAYEAGAEQHSGAGLLRAVLLDKFKSLDDIKANRGLLRPSGNEMQDIKGSWDTMSYDAINDIAEKYFDGSHRKAEDYVTDVAMGKSVSWANAPDGTRKAVDKTLAKLKKEVKGMPTEYFEAKPRSVAQIGDFDAAVVPAGRQSVIDMLRNAGIQDIREYDDAVTGQTRRDVIGGMDEFFFSNANKPLGLLVLEQQARGNERLGGLLTQAGFDINDLSTANVSDLEKLLHAAANQGIVDPRSANNLMRGLLK